MRRTAAAAVIMSGLAWPAAAEAPASLTPTRTYTVEGRFETQDGNPPAVDLSGIACTPAAPGTPRRRCLAINDQDRFAQRAEIEEGRIIAGALVNLIGDGPSPDTIGEPPTTLACSEGEARFKDLDGEAVAYAAPYFYVVGSHGCTRHGRKARLSAFILARLPAEEGGPVQTTYRLSEVLRAAESVGGFFGQDLTRPGSSGKDPAEAGGLNVEGLAVLGDTLYVGLRAPSQGGQAYIVAVAVEPLFSRADQPLPRPEVIPLGLGQGAGIRDLAPLPDGRLLVLSGPTQEQAGVPARLFAAEPRPGGALTPLGAFDEVAEAGRRGKAEALLPLGVEGDRLALLVLFDGLPNGAPRAYSVPLR